MNVNKTARIAGKILLWILGIWFGLLLIIQIILLPPILTRIANSVAEDYVDASVSIGSAYGSVFRHFPRITITVEDLEVTYPHEKYDSIARVGVQGHLLYSGCGESVDTLASISRLSASVSLLTLLSGDLKLPHIEVDSPRIFAHTYADGRANWDIFGGESSAEATEQPADTTASENSSAASSAEDSMNIILKNISISGKPKIVYTDSRDSLFAMITLGSMTFDGNFETEGLHKTSADAKLEKLFIAGRYGADTLAFGLDHLKTKAKDDHMHMTAKANTFMATEAFGRMMVPINFSSDISLPEDPGIAVSLRNIDADIATIPAAGHMDIKVRDDRAVIDGQIDMIKCRIQKVLHQYMALFVPELLEVDTDTEVSATAVISGHYDFISGTMPKVDITLDIPDSQIDYSTFPEKIYLGMNGEFSMDTTGRMSTDIHKAAVHTYGLGLDAAFGIDDIMGEDPNIAINGSFRASLDSLRRFLPDTLNIITQGGLSAELDGSIRMSEMDMYKFSNAKLDGRMEGNGIVFQMPDDTIDVNINGLDIILHPETIKSRRKGGEDRKLMGLTGTLASADVTYKDAFSFKGKDLSMGAKSSGINTEEEEENVSYVGGHFNAEMMQINDSEGTSIKLDKTKNSFQMRPKRGQPTIPVLTLSNQNLRITYITADNRAILTDSKISAKAAMNTLDRENRRKAFMDSLATAHPDVPRDSLFVYLRSKRMAGAVPSWMTDNDFRSSDIKVDLNETFKKYFREWDIEGSAGIRTGIIMTPYLPLRNILRGAYMSMDNNRIAIDSLKVMAGESEICTNGSVSGLRRVLLGRGNIKMDLNISSGSVNADELMKAYTIGSMYEPDTSGAAAEMTNSEFLKQVTTETVQTVEPAPSLFVIPGNVVASMKINTSGIKYKDLDISSFVADMVIKERCAQLTGTSMKSNIGGFDLDAFYATRSKEDIKTGFCLDLKDITSERLIGLMPEIGEVMPMIGSIKGQFDCEVAATASLDTTMSLIMPSVNGIARLSGNNLTVSDDETFTSIARMLMFKDKKTGRIDELMVEGAIKDNRLELFPFLLKVDRYALAVSGVQNMDMSYKHHISVLRSPLLIRLGLNISGPDYDNIKFRLGRAQYRAKKMPSFTAVIDQTKNDLKYSIYNIFETGIDQTINNKHVDHLIVTHQNSIGYVNAAEMDMEELSEEEMMKFEDSSNADTAMEEAMAAAVAAVQEVLKNK